MEKIHHANIYQKKPRVSVLTISNKIVIGAKKITREIEGYDDKNVNTSKVRVFLYAYVPNNKSANYMKQNLIDLKGVLDKTIIIILDFMSFSTSN